MAHPLRDDTDPPQSDPMSAHPGRPCPAAGHIGLKRTENEVWPCTANGRSAFGGHRCAGAAEVIRMLQLDHAGGDRTARITWNAHRVVARLKGAQVDLQRVILF